MNCRFCQTNLEHNFLDLGKTPLANSYLTKEKILEDEKKFPLHAFLCHKCFLVQVDEFEKPEGIFSDYAYFSSFSSSWLEHVKNFCEEIIQKYSLTKNSQILEIASNDGYLLKNFKQKGIPVLGIEPASNVAKIAMENGIPTINKFFGKKIVNELKSDGYTPDILIAFNVLPHVPDLNDFIIGMKNIIKKDGIVIIQFSAYLMDMLEKNEFDMIYHEHFSYFSLYTLKQIFDFHGLDIFDVKRISVHGGSLRLFLKLKENHEIQIKSIVNELLEKEIEFGLNNIKKYDKFQEQITLIKNNIKKFFDNAKNDSKKIVCYGAAAKGNTLLNFCNLGKNQIEYVVDISPHKQGKYLPGTQIPIFSPDKIKETKPDLVIILAYNLKKEIMEDAHFISEWGGKFVILIPEIEVIN